MGTAAIGDSPRLSLVSFLRCLPRLGTVDLHQLDDGRGLLPNQVLDSFVEELCSAYKKRVLPQTLAVSGLACSSARAGIRLNARCDLCRKVCLSFPPAQVVALGGMELEYHRPTMCSRYRICLRTLAQRREGLDYLLSSAPLLSLLGDFDEPLCHKNHYCIKPRTDPEWVGPVLYNYANLEKMRILRSFLVSDLSPPPPRPLPYRGSAWESGTAAAAAAAAAATLRSGPCCAEAATTVRNIDREDVLSLFYPGDRSLRLRKAYILEKCFEALVDRGVPVTEDDFVVCQTLDEEEEEEEEEEEDGEEDEEDEDFDFDFDWDDDDKIASVSEGGEYQ
jgi:hypothetical protein